MVVRQLYMCLIKSKAPTSFFSRSSFQGCHPACFLPIIKDSVSLRNQDKFSWQLLQWGKTQASWLARKSYYPKASQQQPGCCSGSCLWAYFPISFPLLSNALEDYLLSIDHTLWSTCWLLIFIDFPHILLNSSSSFQKSMCFSHSILVVKTIKDIKGLRFYSTCTLTGLTWHSLRAAGRRHETTKSKIRTVYYAQ